MTFLVVYFIKLLLSFTQGLVGNPGDRGESGPRVSSLQRNNTIINNIGHYVELKLT